MKFVTKDEAIETSDVIINAMNLTRIKGSPYYNENYFSYDYLSRAKKGLIFINVTRGEIAPEPVLLKLTIRVCWAASAWMCSPMSMIFHWLFRRGRLRL